ncbi:hypothetical protein D3C77_749050 [compost metagenome]
MADSQLKLLNSVNRADQQRIIDRAVGYCVDQLLGCVFDLGRLEQCIGLQADKAWYYEGDE